MGKGVEKRVNHVQQVDDLMNELIQRNLHDIVLVGHSCAGTLTARLAEEVPDRALASSGSFRCPAATK
jgi:pimeloyl-ACP methyl ester carboxylesterase